MNSPDMSDTEREWSETNLGMDIEIWEIGRIGVLIRVRDYSRVCTHRAGLIRKYGVRGISP